MGWNKIDLLVKDLENTAMFNGFIIVQYDLLVYTFIFIIWWILWGLKRILYSRIYMYILYSSLNKEKRVWKKNWRMIKQEMIKIKAFYKNYAIVHRSSKAKKNYIFSRVGISKK